MEDMALTQLNNDDEVVVRQADGSFKILKMSDISNVASASNAATPADRALQSASGAPSPSADFDRQAASAVERLAGDLSDDLKSRLKMLLISYFKGIRQEYAVRERLLQAVDNGGLGWQEDRADLFLKQVQALGGAGEKQNPRTLPPATVHTQSSAPLAPPISPVRMPLFVATPPSKPNLLPELEPEMRIEKVNEAPPQPRAHVPLPIARPLAPRAPEPARRNVPPLPRPPTPEPPKQKIPQPASVAPKLQPPALAPCQNAALVLATKPPIASAPRTPPSSPAPAPMPMRTTNDMRPASPPVLKIVNAGADRLRVVPQKDPPLIPEKQPPHIAIPQAQNGKAEVKDIVYKPRLIGPVEELHTLTLVDFRRLSRDPQVAVDKIHAKIDLLGEESFEKKTQGILAWRASEVNKLYTTLLNESIKTGRQLKDVLAAHAAKNEQTLALNEFQAIMKLNGQLRF